MTTVNSEVTNFFLQKVNKKTVSLSELKDLKIDVDKKDFLAADKDDNGELDIEELEKANFYKQVLAVIEEDKKVDTPDEEEEKEEQTKVKDKDDA